MFFKSEQAHGVVKQDVGVEYKKFARSLGFGLFGENRAGSRAWNGPVKRHWLVSSSNHLGGGRQGLFHTGLLSACHLRGGCFTLSGPRRGRLYSVRGFTKKSIGTFCRGRRKWHGLKSEKRSQKIEAVKMEKPPWAKAAFKSCLFEN
jgi:hypothetical protein